MSKAEDLINNINKVIVGKNDVVELVVTSLITGGHVLIEDMPGTGKTCFVRHWLNRLMQTSDESSLHPTFCHLI